MDIAQLVADNTAYLISFISFIVFVLFVLLLFYLIRRVKRKRALIYGLPSEAPPAQVGEERKAIRRWRGKDILPLEKELEQINQKLRQLQEEPIGEELLAGKGVSGERVNRKGARKGVEAGVKIGIGTAVKKKFPKKVFQEREETTSPKSELLNIEEEITRLQKDLRER